MPLDARVHGPQIWTGGAYGPEAGLPATILLCAAIVLMLRFKQVEVEVHDAQT